MRQIAVVTGASSGIGRAIAERLLEMDYMVYGVGRDFSSEDCRRMKECFGEAFLIREMDLLREDAPETIARELKELEKEDGELAVLVNNAGVGYYGLHEEISPDKLRRLVRTDLEVPLVLTMLLLRKLKENSGYVINISSVTAGEKNPHGAAYGAVKAGLSSFSASLYEEARKSGLRVTDIRPDMTRTSLYRNADFTCDEGEGASLFPEDVADAVEELLKKREGMTVTQLTLQPRYHRIKRI